MYLQAEWIESSVCNFWNAIIVSNGLDTDQDRYQSWSGSKLFAKVIRRCQKPKQFFKSMYDHTRELTSLC